MVRAIRGALLGVCAVALLGGGGLVLPTFAGEDLPPPRVRSVPGPAERRARPAPSRREARRRPRPGEPLPPPVVRVLKGPGAAAPGRVPPATAPSTAAARASAPPPLDDAGAALPQPTAPPPRPGGGVEAQPEDVVFEVERPGGVFRRFPDGPDREVFVMIGNPRIIGLEHTKADGTVVPPLSIKANRMVLWVDRKHFEPLRLLEDMRGTGGTGDGGRDEQVAAVESIIQEAVLGIYAEGAVELEFGDLAFRADRLHIEPSTYQALLVEPRFEGTARGAAQRGGDLRLHVRARRARLVAKGKAIFDEADVGTARASDRMELRVKTLTVEELEQETGEPTFLGFRNLSAQSYDARGTQLRGERVPLFYWGKAEFGHPSGESFPVRFKRFIYGNRSTLGRYGLIGIGGVIGSAKDPVADWTALLGGYTEKGPSVGAELEWNQPRTYGKLSTWGIYDFDGKDFDDYEPPDSFRWYVHFESRTVVGEGLVEGLQLDAEFHEFSDRGVNLEYWENEQLTHKEYESYARLRYERDTFVATLIGKWHERDFVTETTELPQLETWFTSIPLLVSSRRGEPGVDITSVSRAGYLARRFDTAVPDADYHAWRLDTDTRLNLGVDLGDVRLSGWTGLNAASYLERNDGGEDLTRTALLAGARANLQLHRAWSTQGGILQLDHLRHVIDLDVEYSGRFLDDTDPADVPFFDSGDEVIDRSAGVLRVRNRLQTRRSEGGIRDVLDLELSWLHWVDDVGPWGLEGPGEIHYQLRGEPRPGFLLVGEGRWDLGRNDFYRVSLGLGSQPHEQLAFFTGVRYIRSSATAPFVDLAWRWSDKYGVRLLEQYDFRNGENRTRVVFGRYSADHAWYFGVSLRGVDDVGVEFSFSPTIGTGGPGGRMMFNDQPDLDPWEIYP